MNQQVRQMMELARANERGASVGGCGPSMYMNPEASAMPPAMPGGGAPGCQPCPQPAQPCDQIQLPFSPLGFRFGVDSSGNIYTANSIGLAINDGSEVLLGTEFLVYPRIGAFNIYMIRTFTDPGVALITSMQFADSDRNMMLAPTDAAVWNTDGCGCPFNPGCVSTTSAMRIQAVSLSTPSGSEEIVGVSGVCWGTSVRQLYACGPAIGCGV